MNSSPKAFITSMLNLSWLVVLILLHGNVFGQFVKENSGIAAVESSNDVFSTLANPGTIVVPVKMGGPGLGAVTSFQFYINFNVSKLTFLGVSPAAVSNISTNNVGNLITINWSNPTASINCTSTTTLFFLNFQRNAIGDVPLVFLPGSSVGNLQGLLPVEYINGMLLQTYQLSLSAQPSAGGSVGGAGNYIPNQAVTLTATANPGYQFVSWTWQGSVISTNPNFVYSMPSQDISLVANFAPITYLVSLQAQPAAGGTVQGAGAYPFGQQLTVNAIPAIGYTFVSWMLNGQVVSSMPQYSFTMPANDVHLWANFELIPYALSIAVEPVNAGNVTGAGSYFYNQTVAVNAVPNTGYAFSHWSINGQVVHSQPDYSFSMPSNAVHLVAHFSLVQYQLTLTAIPSDGGTVTGAGLYTFNSTATVNAIPATGYSFGGWYSGGVLQSTQPTFIFAMPAQALTLQAHFDQIAYPLSLQVNPAGTGAVSGEGNYFYQANITVNAIPSTGYHFISWTHNGNIVSTNAQYTFSMPATAYHLVANFSVNFYTIALSSSNIEHGSVSGGGTFMHGTLVTIYAIPNEGHSFVAWMEQSQVVSTEMQYDFVALSNRQLHAIFQVDAVCPEPVQLSVVTVGETFVSIQWVSIPGISSWDVLWGVAGFDTLTQGNLVPNVMQNSLSIQTLNPQSVYDVYVRSRCSGDGLSAWAGPLTFMTQYVGIGEGKNHKLTVKPNPASDFTEVLLPENVAVTHFQLFNPQSRLVRAGSVHQTERFTVPLSGLPAGLYLLRIQAGEFSGDYRIVVLR
jgi:uncharacterized repeat protein (TIGR02543 family)